MNNTGIIVKVNAIEKHPNADKLQLVKLFGTQVITDLSTNVGDLMIYFDSNLKLSDLYLRANNLYKHPELNLDTTKTGYFDDNGRVKCIRLRGEFSDGVLLPIDSLSFITTDKGKYPVSFGQGFEFNDFLGVNICEKYIPKVKIPGEANGKKNSGRKALKSPMFVEHWDRNVPCSRNAA